MAATSNRRGRWQRGLLCWATFLIGPLGWFVRGRHIRRLEPERLDQGLVLILPGIEGRSFFNIAIMRGLLDAGLPYAMEIVDWTTGFKGFVLYHLRGWRRNQRVAARLAERVSAYRRDYPGRPVWLIGHSGGGGMALLTAEALPESTLLTGVVLLAPAVSPQYPCHRLERKVEQGIWNFASPLDFLFLGVGTTLCGSLDGRHGPSAGMLGFHDSAVADSPRVVQRHYRFDDILQFHLGGHFGCTHRVFIEETVAPILAANGVAVTASDCEE
jgi:pimeloyl-ACP methyl ester carboxylesterase